MLIYYLWKEPSLAAPVPGHLNLLALLVPLPLPHHHPLPLSLVLWVVAHPDPDHARCQRVHLGQHVSARLQSNLHQLGLDITICRLKIISIFYKIFSPRANAVYEFKSRCCCCYCCSSSCNTLGKNGSFCIKLRKCKDGTFRAKLNFAVTTY